MGRHRCGRHDRQDLPQIAQGATKRRILLTNLVDKMRLFVFLGKRKIMGMDISDIVMIGALVIVAAVYLQFGGAWALMFVGVILVVTGLIGARRGAKHGDTQ
jgi:hypothetical protein